MVNEKIVPRTFKGTRDFLPPEMMQRERIAGILRGIFRRYGFAPLETPAIEYLDVLMGKYGEEGDRLIFRLAYRDAATAGLRYDLTVPLARVVSQYPQLTRPFKRYQIQPVWRAEAPQLRQGRFREFYQCDVDVVGSTSVLADAEIVALTEEALSTLGFERFRIRVNHRKILAGIVEAAGLGPVWETPICRAMDKFDKVGAEGVSEELVRAGVADEARARLADVLEIRGAPVEVLSAVEPILAGTAQGPIGVVEMRRMLGYIEAFGVRPEHLTLDLNLSRGLDYYTGPVFESVLPDLPHIGSLTGGGRYDGLTGVFAEVPVPGTGTSIGLDRVMTALEQMNALSVSCSPTLCLVAHFDEATLAAALRFTARLRKTGVAAEVYYDADRLKKQFSYADKRTIPFVAVIGPDEAAAGRVTLKRMESGEQELLDEAVAVERLEEAARRLTSER
jgi:histidyl-tRNA synthetase